MNNNPNQPKKSKEKPKNFIEREWNEEIEGELDEDGFFITPNGSFWDPDYVYFNRDGVDKHGGHYDEKGEYIPGEGWDDENNCYESENEFLDEYEDDEEEDDYGYGDYKNIVDNLIEEDELNAVGDFKDDDNIDKEEKVEEVNENINKNDDDKKVIITRENQDKYLKGKVLDELKENNNNEINEPEMKFRSNAPLNINNNNKNNAKNMNNNKKKYKNNNNRKNNNNNKFQNYQMNNPQMYNNPMYNNQMQAQMLNNQKNQMNSMPMGFPYAYQMNMPIPMNMPMNFNPSMGMPMQMTPQQQQQILNYQMMMQQQNMFPMQQIGMQPNNQMVYNQLMAQQIMKQREIMALNQDFEYRLNKEKELSSYKVVDDKK